MSPEGAVDGLSGDGLAFGDGFVAAMGYDARRDECDDCECQ